MLRIQELSNELNSLASGNRVKFDIHFVISEPLSKYCAEVNSFISNYGIGLIDLGDNSICVPHITVLMGYVDSITKFQGIFERIGKYVSRLNTFICEPSALYFKGMSQKAPQYLFLDLNGRDFFEKQKEELENYMSGFYSPLEWDIQKEMAHITVGCYRNLSDNDKNRIASLHTPPKCTIKQMGISLCGERGACLGHLKTYDLN